MNLKVFWYKKKRVFKAKNFFLLIFNVLIYTFTQRKSTKCSDFEGLKNIILSGDGQNLEDEDFLNYYINRENEELMNNDEKLTKHFFYIC